MRAFLLVLSCGVLSVFCCLGFFSLFFLNAISGAEMETPFSQQVIRWQTERNHHHFSAGHPVI